MIFPQFREGAAQQQDLDAGMRQRQQDEFCPHGEALAPAPGAAVSHPGRRGFEESLLRGKGVQRGDEFFRGIHKISLTNLWDGIKIRARTKRKKQGCLTAETQRG